MRLNKIKSRKAVIFGLQGETLSQEEASFFEDVQPLGFILFKRNIVNKQQLQQLTQDLKDCLNNPKTPILIDQEGGRVQRMKAPVWENLPPAQTYGKIFEEGNTKEALDQLNIHTTKIAQSLLEVGINTDCWPCLDVATPQVSPALGDRLFSQNPEIVSLLANQVIEKMLSLGIMPIAKHLPGYGKATVDPHQSLPIVSSSLKELENDFFPFKKQNKNIWGMTAHILYTALDQKNPATTSQKIISFIRNQLDFKGFLITDDISMGALGSDVVLASQKCLDAGCDAVLHCNGNLTEMKAIAAAIPNLTQEALERFKKGEQLFK